MRKVDVSLANFNCTFNSDNKIYPMLHYFDDVILPALTSKDYKRKSGDSNFYLTEVKLVNLADKDTEPEYALIGKHVKRHLITIKNDYKVEKGFIPVGESRHSAPFSVFVLLLKNHRIIHYKDQRESPTLNALASTIRVFINYYRSDKAGEVMNEKGEVYNRHKQNLDKTASKREVYKYFKEVISPEPEINIVPIPSDSIIEERMKGITKIKELSLRVFPLNNEIDTNGFLNAFRKVTEKIDTPSGQVKFNSPKDINAVTEILKDSDGLADFTVKAVTDDGTTTTLKPEEFSENVPVRVDDSRSLFHTAIDILRSLLGRKEIDVVSEENQKEYDRFKKRRS